MNRFFGGMMLAMGLLIMTGSGLCSLLVIIGAWQLFSASDRVLMPAIFGGIPFALGFGLFYAGLAELRHKGTADEERGDRDG